MLFKEKQIRAVKERLLEEYVPRQWMSLKS